MKSSEVPPNNRALSQLVKTLKDCRERSVSEDIRLGDALKQVGKSSFPFVALLLTIPFIQPISLGPLSTVGAIVLALVGWQLLRGHAEPRLPGRLNNVRVHSKVWTILHSVTERIERMLSRWGCRRFVHWTEGRRGRITTAVFLILGGLLIAIPLIGVPFNNTLPALMAATAALAYLEADGRMFLVAAGFLLASLVYFGTLGAGFYYAFHGVMQLLS